MWSIDFVSEVRWRVIFSFDFSENREHVMLLLHGDNEVNSKDFTYIDMVR
jgi:hypothetical protein